MSVFSRIAKNNRIIVVIIKPSMIYKITYIKPFLNQNLTLTIFIRGGGIPANNSLTFFFTLYDIYIDINKKIKFIFHPLTPFLNPTNSEKNICIVEMLFYFRVNLPIQWSKISNFCLHSLKLDEPLPHLRYYLPLCP